MFCSSWIIYKNAPIIPRNDRCVLLNRYLAHSVNYVPIEDFGVADGARTRDTQDHNLVLYQLNYNHIAALKRRIKD